MRTSKRFLTGEKIDLIEHSNGKDYGFDKILYPRLIKLVKTIEQDEKINSLVSFEFINKNCADWFFDTYKHRKAKCDLSVYILKKIHESVKEYIIHFPVLFINLDGLIKIGNAYLGHYSKQYLDKLENSNLSKNAKQINHYISIRDKIQGKVLISYKVKAELNKAKQIAFEECSLAIDVLKLCLRTNEIPNYIFDFDIDSRTTLNGKNTVFCIDSLEPENFTILESNASNKMKMNHRDWDIISNEQFPNFNNFLIKKNDFDTELKRLILRAIRKYAKAISLKNLNQRVVELFTILESLLLKDQNPGILDSLCKYCPRLLYKSIEDRKFIISMLRRMYKIRSEMVHHASEKEFRMKDLVNLQGVNISLINHLILKLETNKTMKEILDEIDDKIMRA